MHLVSAQTIIFISNFECFLMLMMLSLPSHKNCLIVQLFSQLHKATIILLILLLLFHSLFLNKSFHKNFDKSTNKYVQYQLKQAQDLRNDPMLISLITLNQFLCLIFQQLSLFCSNCDIRKLFLKFMDF